MAWLVWWFALGVAWSANPPATPGSALRAEIVRGLLPREDAVACVDLLPAADPAARRAALVDVAENVEHPAWVAVRAAACVTDLAGSDPAARSAAEAWLSDPNTFGLAVAVLDHLDALDEPTALALARVAIARSERESRFARYARPILSRSRYTTIRVRTGVLGD